MPEVEPYEVMPYSEISALKKEIKKLKNKEDDVESKDLVKSMNGLTQNIDSMLQIFRKATEEMQLEEEEEKAVSKQINPLMEKLDEIIEQNKIIAEGMVALSDIVKERFPEKKMQKPPMNKPNMPSSPNMNFQQNSRPSMPPPPDMNKFPNAPPQNSNGPNMPPPTGMANNNHMPPPPDMPPPEKEKKKGFFGK